MQRECVARLTASGCREMNAPHTIIPSDVNIIKEECFFPHIYFNLHQTKVKLIISIETAERLSLRIQRRRASFIPLQNNKFSRDRGKRTLKKETKKEK